MSVRIQCAHCAGMIPVLDCDIDSGSMWTCPRCAGETVVDLFTPAERAELYEAAGRM